MHIDQANIPVALVYRNVLSADKQKTSFHTLCSQTQSAMFAAAVIALMYDNFFTLRRVVRPGLLTKDYCETQATRIEHEQGQPVRLSHDIELQQLDHPVHNVCTHDLFVHNS